MRHFDRTQYRCLLPFLIFSCAKRSISVAGTHSARNFPKSTKEQSLSKFVEKFYLFLLVVLLALAGCAESDDNIDTSVPPVNTNDRQAVVALYKDFYLPGFEVKMEWTGSVAAQNPGTVSPAYSQATVQRLNYFRALCGLPSVGWNASQSAKCQQAALMMSANNALSHEPPSSWLCYTADGAEAAGKSNLYLGVAGPRAIDGYIDDSGVNNSAVGHRRWIFYPPLSEVGTGSVNAAGGYKTADALWVLGNTGPRPGSPKFVAWPSAGYFPRRHLPASGRWSFSVADANWSSTTITMTRDGSSVGVTMEPDDIGFGDRTIVWLPENGGPAGYQGPEDVWVVTVNGVKVDNATKNYSYTVRVFNQDE